MLRPDIYLVTFPATIIVTEYWVTKGHRQSIVEYYRSRYSSPCVPERRLKIWRVRGLNRSS
jgi:hypothetical protein